jgi:hypothetical protein
MLSVLLPMEPVEPRMAIRFICVCLSSVRVDLPDYPRDWSSFHIRSPEGDRIVAQDVSPGLRKQ